MRPTQHPAARAAALSLLACLPGLAAAEKPVELASIVVTATRQPTRADRVLADITVIDRDEIAAAGWSSVPEMLAAQPGVELSSTGGTGQPASLFLRGANGGHTLVLLDGMRLNSATLGTASLEAVPLSAIERVEILRGPSSSLYGADAVGGVVQLFTRQIDGVPRVQAAAAAGNYGASRAEVAAGGSRGPWSFTVAGSRERTGSVSAIRGPDPRWATVFFTTDPFNPDADGNRNDSLTGQLRFRPVAGHEVGIQASRFSAVTRKDATQCDPVFFFPCTAAYDSRTYQNLSGTGLFWTGKLLAGWTSTLRAEESEDRMRDYRLNPTTGGEFFNRFTTRQRQYTWQNDLAVGPGTALLAIERLDQRIDADRGYTGRSRSIDALIGGYDVWFGSHGLQANLRRDHSGQFGSRGTGGLTYAYRTGSGWQFQAGAKTAFKAPTFNDLYFPADPMFGGGNPNLRPEQARGMEAAVRYRTAAWHAGATLYRNRVSDLIEWRANPGKGPFYWEPQNVSQALLRGVTFEVAATFGDWNLNASLDRQDPRDLQRQVLLNNRSRLHGKLRVDRRTGPWRYGVAVTASGRRWEDDAFSAAVPADRRERLGGYALVNATADYALSREWSVFVRINNLFDKRYEPRFNYGAEGTRVLVGLRFGEF